MVARIMPCLLLDNGGLVKTTRFATPRYVGDPVNAVRIFNDKEADELVLLDIGATRSNRPPDLSLIEDIASEAFMPLCYGGGVSTIAGMHAVFKCGVEKVLLGTAAIGQSNLVREAAGTFGSQSVVVAIDVRARRHRYSVYVRSGTVDTGKTPEAFAEAMAGAGAGELLLTSIDREGTGTGFDLSLIRQVAHAVDVPIVANGGARSLLHCGEALAAGASAVAAGSMFVFSGRHRAVLISYLSSEDRAHLSDRGIREGM